MDIKKKEEKKEAGVPEKEVKELGGDAPKKEKTPNPSTTEKTVNITIDISPDDVIKYDNDGVKLTFAHERGAFLRLPSDVVRGLSYENKQRYFISKGMYEESLNFDHYDKRNAPIRAGFATATDRLKVENGDPSKHYCWKRPDELRQAQMEGYRVVHDDSIGTFNSDPGTSHTVGMNGIDELVLMEIPKAQRDQQRAANREKDKRRREGVESSTIDDISRSGGKPFIPKEE